MKIQILRNEAACLNCGEVVRLQEQGKEQETQRPCACGNLTLKKSSNGALVREHHTPFAEMSVSIIIN